MSPYPVPVQPEGPAQPIAEPSGVPYGMQAGVRAVLPGINDQPRPPPYGMFTGQRHVMPEQINLDAPEAVKPEAMTLDEDPSAAGPLPPMKREPGGANGWKITGPDGRVYYNQPAGGDRERDKSEIQALGKTLLDHAVTDIEKQAAMRATDWGMAQAGAAKVGDITKQMADFWRQGSLSSDKFGLQSIRSKANLGGKGGVPNGPTKGEKFENANNLDDAKFAAAELANTEQNAKLASLSDMENELGRMIEMASSDNPMSQRGALMEYMKTLSGKQSTDMERRQLANADGIISSLKNTLSLWGTDPSLTSSFVAKFIGNARTLQSEARARRSKIADQAGARMVNSLRFEGRDDATKEKLRKYARSAIMGEEATVDPNSDLDSKL